MELYKQEYVAPFFLFSFSKWGKYETLTFKKKNTIRIEAGVAHRTINDRNYRLLVYKQSDIKVGFSTHCSMSIRLTILLNL